MPFSRGMPMNSADLRSWPGVPCAISAATAKNWAGLCTSPEGRLTAVCEAHRAAGIPEKQFFGTNIDPTAVMVDRINLLLKFRDVEFVP